ncbi:hypothetical protein HDU97_007614 [Phlyctochytrium planicorne]|nr:hypothetical protein HDU97_007614 [Phlyctochytrium planicorne]
MGVSSKYTFGWKRAEVLGAFANGVLLISLCISIVVEALQRFAEPVEIENPMFIFIVGCCGLLMNLIGMILFRDIPVPPPTADPQFNTGQEYASLLPAPPTIDDTHLISPTSLSTPINPFSDSTTTFSDTTPLKPTHSIDMEPSSAPSAPSRPSSNMRALFLHALGDAAGNLAVMISSMVMMMTEWKGRVYVDPVVSILIAGVVGGTAVELCRGSIGVLLEGVPGWSFGGEEGSGEEEVGEVDGVELVRMVVEEIEGVS